MKCELNTVPDRDNPLTFSGARQSRLRDQVERMTATDRVHHLEELLSLAESSGALARKRERERRYWERVWKGEAGLGEAW